MQSCLHLDPYQIWSIVCTYFSLSVMRFTISFVVHEIFQIFHTNAVPPWKFPINCSQIDRFIEFKGQLIHSNMHFVIQFHSDCNVVVFSLCEGSYVWANWFLTPLLLFEIHLKYFSILWHRRTTVPFECFFSLFFLNERALSACNGSLHTRLEHLFSSEFRALLHLSFCLIIGLWLYFVHTQIINRFQPRELSFISLSLRSLCFGACSIHYQRRFGQKTHRIVEYPEAIFSDLHSPFIRHQWFASNVS